LKDNLAEANAKTQAVENELNKARQQMTQVRAQLSDGATGSEALSKRLEEEEQKVLNLTEEVASRKSHMGSLEEELLMYKEQTSSLQEKLGTLSGKYEGRDTRTKDLTQRLYSQNDRLIRLLDRVGYTVQREEGSMAIRRMSRSDRSSQNPNDSSDPGSVIRRSTTPHKGSMHDSIVLELLYWMDKTDSSTEGAKYDAFMEKLGSFDADLFADTLYQRIKEAEHKARKWQREAKAQRERSHAMQKDAQEKIAFKHFKEGDLALFLPTRNQQAGAWAAFNVGFPHFFLREQESHRLRNREWLVARISKIQERVVDLSKSMQPTNETDSTNEEENDNPFQLSDGLRWYLIDAYEDKPGAPSTPGMGKSTVAANRVEATAKLQTHGGKDKHKSRDSVTSIEGINKTLSKSLESRRSSSGSKKASSFMIGGGAGHLKNSALASETNSLRAGVPDTPAGTSPTQGDGVAGSSRTQPPEPQENAHQEVVSGGQGAVAQSSEVRNVDSLLGP
jgi:autophagy-related protein 11